MDKLFQMHSKEALLEEQQKALALAVAIPKVKKVFSLTDLIFSLDIQYKNEEAYVAVDIQNFKGEQQQRFLFKGEAGMEYIPRFFCFREGPPLLQAIEKVIATTSYKPQLLLVDGHGIAHPRRLGVASWLGVHVNCPSIGIGKKALLLYSGDLAEERGATLEIEFEGELRGFVLRSQQGVKPIFVSPGHAISIEQSREICLDLASNYRICEPIRRADQAARRFAKGEEPLSGWQTL